MDIIHTKQDSNGVFIPANVFTFEVSDAKAKAEQCKVLSKTVDSQFLRDFYLRQERFWLRFASFLEHGGTANHYQ